MSDYRLADWDTGFFSSLCVQTGSGARPSSSPMGTGGKERQGSDADNSPPYGAVVKND
jgi:hypothetical protein